MTTINETIASAVAENISKNVNNDGMFSIEMEMDNVLVYIDGSFEISGYAEDDYFNGTGAWVATYALVKIDSIEAYDEVCGGNIAIDTDDLVLVNQNVCVVIGTYGRRGADSPVDWAEHLEERADYHVSWPEYLFILEMVLAKKYVIACANDRLVDATLNAGNLSSSELIAFNAELGIRLSRMVLQLNVVKYSKFMSHKVMFDRTTRRLDIEEDQKKLIKLMDMVDSSLHNISDYKSVKSDFVLNFILAIISVVSTFEILFQDVSLPFVEYIGLTSNRTAAVMVWFVAALAFFAILLVLVNAIRHLMEKTKKLFER